MTGVALLRQGGPSRQVGGMPGPSRGVSDRIGCPDHPPADSRGETPVESSLVATKVRVPAPRSGLIGRARLIDRLEGGLASRLVLVSAPAGFGKTSLLTQWLAAVADHGHTAAWLALDQSDNRAHTFWPHLVACLLYTSRCV